MLDAGLLIRMFHGDEAGMGLMRGSYLCDLKRSISLVNGDLTWPRTDLR